MNPEDRAIISVDLDWCSTGIWFCRSYSEKRWANMSYSQLPLPEWLIERFEFWTDWYNRKDPVGFSMSKDEAKLFEAYALSLALDLKRVLDREAPGHYEVRLYRKQVIEVPEDAKGDKPEGFSGKPRKRPQTKPLPGQADPHFGTTESMLAWCEKVGLTPVKDKRGEWDWLAVWEEYGKRADVKGMDGPPAP